MRTIDNNTHYNIPCKGAFDSWEYPRPNSENLLLKLDSGNFNVHDNIYISCDTEETAIRRQIRTQFFARGRIYGKPALSITSRFALGKSPPRKMCKINYEATSISKQWPDHHSKVICRGQSVREDWRPATYRN